MSKPDVDKDQPGVKVVYVDVKMFLARGAVLRNSGNVYALVT